MGKLPHYQPRAFKIGDVDVTQPVLSAPPSSRSLLELLKWSWSAKSGRVLRTVPRNMSQEDDDTIGPQFQLRNHTQHVQHYRSTLQYWKSSWRLRRLSSSLWQKHMQP
ncbi:hypothetical protein COCOBI_07-0710 [Coccomyxa sp. Obi]|nr:hypothetical protein COCOBI_07-0710 [Coccomyxa sp. Obi]